MRNCGKQDNVSARAERSRCGHRHCAQGLVPRRGARSGHVHDRAQQRHRQARGEPRRPPVQSHDAQRLAHRCRTRVRRTGRPGVAGHSRRHGGGAVAAGDAVRRRSASTPLPRRRERSSRRWCWSSSAAIRKCMSISSPKDDWSTSSPRDFDLGVRVADLVPSDMIAVSLGRPQRYAVVGSPAYFEKHGRPRVPPDLLNHQCIRVRLPNGALYRWQFEKGGQTAQIDVSGPITLDEASLARTAVLEGVGLGFFMEQDVRRRHRGGTPRSRAGGLDAALCRALPLLSRTAQPLGRPQGVHRPGPRTQCKIRIVITRD